MEVVVIGNGAIAMQTAYSLVARDSSVRVVVIGPHARPGCASVAAAAMFNSLAEVDRHGLTNGVARERFEFNRSAVPVWPELLSRLAEESGRSIAHGFGTYVIGNTTTDASEDAAFDAIERVGNEYGAIVERVDPTQIPGYAPEARQRALRALFIPEEGWMNPNEYIAALQTVLENSGRCHFIDDACDSLRLNEAGARVIGAVTRRHGEILGDLYICSPGARFSEIMNSSGIGDEFQPVFFGVGVTVSLQTDHDLLTNCVRTPNRGLACGIYTAPRGAGETILGATNLVSPVPLEGGRAMSVYGLLKAGMEQVSIAFQRAQVAAIHTGWRPTTADTLPLIGMPRQTNLLVATGTKRDGVHCAPVIADWLTDLAFDGRSDREVTTYTPNRKVLHWQSRRDAIDALVEDSVNALYQHDFQQAKGGSDQELREMYRAEFENLHDRVGAMDWGIPSELKDMYKHGHVSVD